MRELSFLMICLSIVMAVTGVSFRVRDCHTELRRIADAVSQYQGVK